MSELSIPPPHLQSLAQPQSPVLKVLSSGKWNMHPYPSLHSMKNSTENLHTNVRVQRVKIPNGKNIYGLEQLSKRPAHNHAKI